MKKFDNKEIYIENGKRVLEINILPEKYCNFDCVFCPIGRTQNKIDSITDFGDIEAPLAELSKLIEKTNPQLIFINSKGEAIIHSKLDAIIDFIKSKDLPVRLLSNGYLFGKPEYLPTAKRCDEVIGELKAVTEEDFKKLQRPIEGYTLSEYIQNMISFRKQYDGKFIFEITIIKNYNDDDKSVATLCNVIKEIAPDELMVVRLEEEKFKNTLMVEDGRFFEIEKQLNQAAAIR